MPAAFKHSFNELPYDASGRAAIANFVNKSLADKVGLFSTLESLRNSDIVQTIIDVLLDDGVNQTDSAVFEVEYEMPDGGDYKEISEEINDTIKKLLDEIKLSDFLMDIVDDFLLFGEYPFRIRTETGKGVVELVDDVDSVSTVPVYRGSDLQYFLEKRKDAVYVVPVAEMGTMTLFPRKIRVRVNTQKYDNKKIPEHVRIGRSVIFSAINKIQQLNIIEMAITIGDFKRALSPTMVGISVPASQSPDEAYGVVKKYEDLLNNEYFRQQISDNPSMAELMRLAARYKMIPVWGDGKGQITPVELQNNTEELFDRVDKQRRYVAKVVGVPQAYLALTDENKDTKIELLKTYSRYTRKLMAIQNSIKAAIKRLVRQHLILKGLPVKEENIKVRMKSIVSADSLDFIEYAAAAVSTLNDINATVKEIADSDAVQLKVNNDKFLAFVNKFLKPMEGGDLIFEVDKFRPPEGLPEEPAGGEGPVVGPGGEILGPEEGGEEGAEVPGAEVPGEETDFEVGGLPSPEETGA